jgi:uncharacterized protein YjbK
MKKQQQENPPPPETPEKIEQKKIIAQEQLKKVSEELRSVDVSDVQKIQFMDMDDFRKKLAEAKEKR